MIQRAGLCPDGVVLLSNYDGRYLGDPIFEPLWADLDRREAIVYIHPAKPAIPLIEGIPGLIVDYPFGTTRTAVQLVLNGVLDRHRRVRIMLSHAGGFLPFAAYRFAEVAAALHPDGPGSEPILASFKRFFFDTALSSGPAALPGLKAFAGTDQVLYGSDFPYAPTTVSASFAMKLDADADLSKGQQTAINNGNARQLFGRLSGTPSASPVKHFAAA